MPTQFLDAHLPNFEDEASKPNSLPSDLFFLYVFSNIEFSRELGCFVFQILMASELIANLDQVLGSILLVI